MLRRLPRRLDKITSELVPGISLYPLLGYCLLFVGCVLALRSLVPVFRRSWSP
jgi:hypothetical protein